MPRFRFHRGTLEESLGTTIEIADREQLAKAVQGASLLHERIDIDTMSMRYHGMDKRTGWDTWVVLVNGHVVGHADGHIPAPERIAKIGVSWKGLGAPVLHEVVDLSHARRITPDVDGDLAASVASMLVRQHFEDLMGDEPVPDSVRIEIDSPDHLKGIFEVAISRSVRDKKAPPSERVRPAKEGDPDVSIGTLARRIMPPATADLEGLELASARLTAPEDVRHAYELMSDIYGHHLSMGRNDEEDAQLAVLDKKYEDGIIHDLGWAARSRASGRLGFLAYADKPDTMPDHALENIHEKHGLLPQVAKGMVNEDAELIVCFVPFDRIEEAKAISAALWDVYRDNAPTAPAA